MIAQSFMPEVNQEYANTRKILERVPLESFAWLPHEKSMTLERLATHVATLPQWITITLTTNDLDISNGAYKPEKFTTREGILASFDKHVAAAKETLANTPDDVFMQPWSLRRGENILFTMPKIAVLRSFALNHIIHHRAQLQVYLRLLNIPVPGMYGPSADEA